MDSERYARQGLIAWLDQERLSGARILVAGVGALGNEVLKNLVLLGLGNLTLIDFDHVERTNLSRCLLFHESDIGSPKANVAAKNLRKLNPNVNIQGIHGDLSYDLGLGHLRHSDLVIGCLDSLAARSQLGSACVLAGVPCLDGAIWSMGGEVRWFAPGAGPCFDCTLSARDWQRANERFSCSGFRGNDPDEPAQYAALISVTAIIAGMMVQEAVKWLCGQPVAEGKAIVYNGQSLSLHRAEIPRNPHCPSAHLAYDNVTELAQGTAELSPRRILSMARKLHYDTMASGFILELGRDLVAAFECPQCGQRQTIFRVQSQVHENELTCPHCHADRHAELLRSVDENSPYADHALARLGVPPGEVMAVHGPAGICLFELTGDIRL
ncbi:MAG: ThiF family adenylyltransferase [Gammaproteobacteria bacterium]|nr:ThiF family adenylyltransferase [Gammaproteobacteria bacterium]